MKPTVSRETKTESSESNSKSPIIEITSPDGNKESAASTEKAKGHYSSSGPSLLPVQTPTVTPPPTVSRKILKRSWFGRRNTVSVRWSPFQPVRSWSLNFWCSNTRPTNFFEFIDKPWTALYVRPLSTCPLGFKFLLLSSLVLGGMERSLCSFSFISDAALSV